MGQEHPIERVLRESGRNLSAYGMAIRLQQQFGLSWAEAEYIAKWGLPPPRRREVIPPKKVEPTFTITREYVPESAPIPKPPVRPSREAALAALMAGIDREYAQSMFKARKALSPEERLHQLTDSLAVRGSLIRINQAEWNGKGEVEDQPIIKSSPEGLLGVTMLSVPYVSRMLIETTKVVEPYEKLTWSRKEDFANFASVRVGIFVPDLKDVKVTDTRFPPDGVGIRVMRSNLIGKDIKLADGRVTHSYEPELSRWPRIGSGIRDGLTSLPVDLKDFSFEDLLQQNVRLAGLDIDRLTKPDPWYIRWFS